MPNTAPPRSGNSFVSARLGQLRKRLAGLSLVNVANILRDRVGFGSTVKLYGVEHEAETKFKLVMSEDSDFAKGLICTTSPIGRALMGKEDGSIRLKSPLPPVLCEFEVLEFRTIEDDA